MDLLKALLSHIGAVQDIANQIQKVGDGKDIGNDLDVAAHIAGAIGGEAVRASPAFQAANMAVGIAKTVIPPRRPIIENPEGQPLASSGFKFSTTSASHLNGVNDDLAKCVCFALLNYTTQDFMVYEGLRTAEAQALNVKRGTSQLKHSLHQDGLAVDLVPIIHGIPKWDWEGCYRIALAMDQAATHLGIAARIVWGGDWSRTLADYGGGNALAYAQAVEHYRDSHPGPDFIDGPHFQIKA